MSTPSTPPSTTFSGLLSGGVVGILADTVSANALAESTAVIARGIARDGTRAATNLIMAYCQGDPMPTSAPVTTAIDEALNALAATSLALTAARALVVANPGIIRLVPNTAGVYPRSQRFFS